MQDGREAASGSPSCWVCGSDAARDYKPRSVERALVPSDLEITDGRYGTTLALARCGDCGFVFARAAELPELTRLYEQLDDPGYEGSQEPRALQMRWLLDVVQRSHPRLRSLLDVGAGAGLLVSLARERGLDAEGVEPSQSLVRAAERLHGVTLLQGTLPHPALEGRRFDAVLLVDVIEHVTDPLGLLASARALLAPGGVVVVVTPELGSVAQRLLGFRWWHFRLAHVGYFDLRSFERACLRVGLAIAHKERARWFFTAGYLAERVTRYLPIAGLGARLRDTALGRRASELVVPLNLHDSWLFLCRRADEATAPEASS